MIYQVRYSHWDMGSAVRWFGSKKAAQDFAKKWNAQEGATFAGEWASVTGFSRKTPKTKAEWLKLVAEAGRETWT